MTTEFQALVLGAVQGLTEFLPVSSSAHLVLVPWLFGWNDPQLNTLAFDVALHLGSLLALLAYYRREWTTMLLSIVRPDPASRRLLMLLIVASIPGAIIGLLLEKQAETIFRSPLLIASTLGVMGIVLWIADAKGPETKTIGHLTLRDAVLVGLSQALAIIPGVSRSGSTITTARILSVAREDAANFSFLMATPIIAGAGLHEAPKILHAGINAIVVGGFVSSAVFSLIAIAALVRFVRTRTYQPFAWYRIAIALLVIAIYVSRAG
jgi:undecaprenyl-diphosphatase